MISELLEQQLDKLNLGTADFSELLIRLLDYGVICRDESQIEEALYDRFVACEALIRDYLQPLAIRLQHDSQFAQVRAYPPGAVVPGLADEESQPFNQGLRAKPNQQEVAVILVLRVEYDKALREGQVDERGSVLLSLEALAISLNNLLKRSLPESVLERKQLFRRLRQLRLVNFNAEAFDDAAAGGESWLRIRPGIVSFVGDDVLQSLLGEGESLAAAGQQREQQLLDERLDSGTAFASESEEQG